MAANPSIKDANKIYTGNKLNLSNSENKTDKTSKVTKLVPKGVKSVKVESKDTDIKPKARPVTKTEIAIKKHQQGGTVGTDEEKKQELFPYFAFLYSQKLNPEKYGQVKSMEEWSKLIQENEEDLNTILKVASELTDEEWETIGNQYAETQATAEEQNIQMAAKGAKLKRLKTQQTKQKQTKAPINIKTKSSKMKKRKCTCGCDLVLTKGKGGKLTEVCACGCGGKMNKTK